MSAEKSPESGAVRVRANAESAILHTLEVEVDTRRVKRAFDRAYRDLAKRVPVKGFRPGKVPRSVLERLYGASLTEQIEGTLVAETLGEAIEQVGLEPATEPAVETTTPVSDQAFRYTARVEVKPEIELPELGGLAARKPRVEVGDDEVLRELESLRQRNAPLVEEPEGTRLGEGHIASIDFVGRVDDKPFQGGSGRGVELEVGAGRFLPGFEEQLLGAGAGEDRELTVRFPEDYGNADLAGKEAVFAVHVAAIQRRQPPDLDDEFAKDVGDFETLDDLRARIRMDLAKAREQASQAELHRTLLDSLIERASFEVPPGLVERQLEQQLRSAHQRLEGQIPHEALHEQLERWKEEWRERAVRQVRETLLLEAVARAQGIEAGAEDVASRIEEMAREQGVSTARLRKTYRGEDLERVVAARLVDERTLEFLAGQAKVEETTDT